MFQEDLSTLPDLDFIKNDLDNYKRILKTYRYNKQFIEVPGETILESFLLRESLPSKASKAVQAIQAIRKYIEDQGQYDVNNNQSTPIVGSSTNYTSFKQRIPTTNKRIASAAPIYRLGPEKKEAIVERPKTVDDTIPWRERATYIKSIEQSVLEFYENIEPVVEKEKIRCVTPLRVPTAKNEVKPRNEPYLPHHSRRATTIVSKAVSVSELRPTTSRTHFIVSEDILNRRSVNYGSFKLRFDVTNDNKDVMHEKSFHLSRNEIHKRIMNRKIENNAQEIAWRRKLVVVRRFKPDIETVESKDAIKGKVKRIVKPKVADKVVEKQSSENKMKKSGQSSMKNSDKYLDIQPAAPACIEPPPKTIISRKIVGSNYYSRNIFDLLQNGILLAPDVTLNATVAFKISRIIKAAILKIQGLFKTKLLQRRFKKMQCASKIIQRFFRFNRIRRHYKNIQSLIEEGDDFDLEEEVKELQRLSRNYDEVERLPRPKLDQKVKNKVVKYVLKNGLIGLKNYQTKIVELERLYTLDKERVVRKTTKKKKKEYVDATLKTAELAIESGIPEVVDLYWISSIEL